MKYFIQYPSYIVCNLRCPYCFHAAELATGKSTGGDFIGQGGPNFSIENYINWRNTHLNDRDELVINFHSGEPTMEQNISLIEEFCSKTTEETIDILTNGVGPTCSYDRLISLKSRLFRVGFTYHRKVIVSNPDLGKTFVDRVFMLRKKGISVYVKEMLFTDSRQEIISHQKFWNSLGIPFKIQDFKGYEKGEDFAELKKYTIDDINIIDKEYIKMGSTCTCLPGYKQIMIRGGWQAGDILGCWIDPVVVGNIKDNTYNPNYKAELNPFDGKTRLIGVPKIYKGTYECDRYYENLKKKSSIDYTSTDTLKGDRI